MNIFLKKKRSPAASKTIFIITFLQKKNMNDQEMDKKKNIKIALKLLS